MTTKTSGENPSKNDKVILETVKANFKKRSVFFKITTRTNHYIL